MGRIVDVDDIVGPLQIAERLGVNRDTVYAWRERHPAFPPPIAVLGEGERAFAVWAWSDIEAWARATGRLP